LPPELQSTGVGYWVDFMRDAPEYTGDEADDFIAEVPKVYEEVIRM